MISDITLGQYFPGFSIIHKLDPRTKLILSVFLIAAVFIAANPISFFIVTVLIMLMIPMSRIRFSVVVRGIKPVLFVLIFTSVLTLFMTSGEDDPLVHFWIFRIYKEGVLRAFFMTLRVVLLIVGSSLLLTYTTSPITLTDGLESLLHPLAKLHVPVHIFAMMMTIALRFIPTLIEETEKIMNAQKSRGADFTTGSLIKRAKALVPLLIPLFVSAFKRAGELATAMECRCYRVDRPRTKLNKLAFRPTDYVFLFGGVVLLAGIILLRVLAPASPSQLLQRWFFYPI